MGLASAKDISMNMSAEALHVVLLFQPKLVHCVIISHL